MNYRTEALTWRLYCAGPAEKSRRVEPDDILMTVDGHPVYGLDSKQISEKYELCPLGTDPFALPHSG